MRIEKDMNLQSPEGMDLFKHSKLQFHQFQLVQKFNFYFPFPALIAGTASMIFLQIVCIFSFVLLVRGTRTHNPKQIKPSILLFAMFTTFSVLGLFARFSPTSIVNFVFNFYIFVLLFSLYKKYQEQQHRRGTHIVVTHNPNFIPIMYQEKA